MNKLEGEAYIRGANNGTSHYLEIDLAKAEAFLKKNSKRILLHLSNGKSVDSPIKKALEIAEKLLTNTLNGKKS